MNEPNYNQTQTNIMNPPPFATQVEIPEIKNYNETHNHHCDHDHDEHGFLIMLKTTLKAHLTNTHFISFILFTSFPLLFLMIFFEYLLERTITESLKILPSPFRFLPKQWTPLLQEMQNPTWDFYQRLIFIPFIYLFPLHLLKLIAAYITINLSSKSHTNDPNWISIDKERLRGSFITSLYALFMSTCFMLGFVWLVTGFYNYAPFVFFALIIMPIFCALAVILFPKYLEMSTIWHLGMVFSVLEKVQGIEALNTASFFCKQANNLDLGRNLMLVFYAWGLGLRIPCLFFDDGAIGIIVRSSLLWLGELIICFVFVVYYYYCKSKVLGIRVDKEMGGKI